MKVLLSALLIVSLIACLAACGSKSPSGTYTLVSMESEEMTVDAEASKSFGMESSITFNSDGTGSIDLMGQSEAFTWKGNKITNSNGEEITFRFSGGTITIERNGAKIVFEK